VLVGALLGYGWAARQPTLYQGVARVLLAVPGSPAPPGEPSQPPVDLEQYLRQQAQLMSSAPVLERAVKLSGNRISAETLGQRLEVDAAQDADLLTIRVVDSTATGAAQLANAVPTAYNKVLGQQSRARSRDMVRQLRNIQSPLKTRLAEIDANLPAGRTTLFSGRSLRPSQLSAVQSRLRQLRTAAERSSPVQLVERAAVPKQPISPSPGRAMVIGMLVGLLVSAVLVWWLTRRQRPTSRSSASEPGPEMPSPA
jgi:capsular polysaccharide biosynthesis protein